jgi:hypothetical protein
VAMATWPINGAVLRCARFIPYVRGRAARREALGRDIGLISSFLMSAAEARRMSKAYTRE